MPANFGEIANYHSRLAAQHMALALEARNAGDRTAAEYNRQLAARYIEAAEEQKMAMGNAPGSYAANQAPRPWAEKPRQAPKPAPKSTPKRARKVVPKRTPLAVSCLSAFCSGAASMATALQHSLSLANALLQSLSFRDTPQAPAPQLRG